MSDNVVDIRKTTVPDGLRKFVFETEDDFRAIRLLSGAIQRLTTADEDAHIWQIAREIDAHLGLSESAANGLGAPTRNDTAGAASAALAAGL
jgi:hypothetical protein